MNAPDWEKIRKNWDELTKVFDYEIIPRLFQKNVLSSDDKDALDEVQGRRKKMEKVLNILKEKESKKNAFMCLLEALEDSQIEKYQELAVKIKETETTADPSLVAEIDSMNCKDKVRDILSLNYTNKEGQEIPLSHIRKCIRDNEGFSNAEWSNKELGHFLTEQFVGVIIVSRNERIGKKKVKKEYVQNVCQKQQPAKETKEKLSPAQVKANQGIKNFSPMQLKKFLENRFLKEGLSIEPLDQMEENEISGCLFLTMTESDVQKVMPSASYGAQLMIRDIIDEYTGSKSVSCVSHQQNVRSFDVAVQPGFFYVRGRYVNTDIQARAKKTNRIKNFHLLAKQTEQDKKEYIAAETVSFAAACINQRRNGTIYFGISPEKTQHHQAGEVVGMYISKEDLEEEVDSFLNEAFFEHNKIEIQGTVRSARFIPVILQGDQDDVDDEKRKLYVIEYDIVPGSDILEDHFVKVKLQKIPHLFKKLKIAEGTFAFSDDGKPRLLKETELYVFEMEREKIFKQRKADENESMELKRPKKNLCQMMQNLLTAGHPVIEDDIFVVLSPLDGMNREGVLPNISFLKHLHPEVVFDFDGKTCSDGIYHVLDDDENLVTRVLTLDDFTVGQKDKEKHNALAAILRREKHTCWVFCNGYEETNMISLGCTEWNKTRRTAFSEVLKTFLDIVHSDNALVLICLFSSNYDVMLEASEEIVLRLPRQWVLLAESDRIANVWQQTMLQRFRIDQSDARERCIVDMPWSQINRCITGWCQKEEVTNVEIPRGNGTFACISEKTISSWCDVEVVSAADHVIREENEEKHQLHVNKLEEDFYRGDQVQWLNFFYPDQVLIRDLHKDLRNNVEDALKMQIKDEEVKIVPVYFNHQPGAGGTTSAKQVLWSLRKEYRCCVVKDITEQTCTQLKDIYLHDDTNPKPILVLLDNPDEDKFENLQADLDRVTLDLQAAMQKEINVFCVLLICVRCAALTPAKRKARMVFLKQELSEQELGWFRKKSKELESRFDKDNVGNVDPRFLISFNILKENFNQEYITKVVREFMDGIIDESEHLLLKYVSVLNTHDMSFTAIPIASLNRIMQSTKVISKHTLVQKEETCIDWERNVSQSLKLLLNVTSTKRRHIPKTVRVFHKLIANEILKYIKTITGQSESEIMDELLEPVFKNDDRDSKEMQKIVTNVIRKRPFKKDDPCRKEQFSYLILSIKRHEGDEKAIEILKSLYTFDQDPFTAQQIARSYIEMKNFSEAERYAKYATDKLPSNSFMWDTYGQVYKNQLFDRIDSEESLINHSCFTCDDISEFIDLYKRAIYFFKTEQEISEMERNAYSGRDNFAGYFNELRCILLLLSCLQKCSLFATKDDLHNYLVGEKFSLGNLDQNQTECIKSLNSSARRAMQKLEDENLQRKSKFSMDNNDAQEKEYFQNCYSSLKRSLYEFLGETTKPIQAHSLSEKELCEYRYRRVLTLGATSLQSLLDLAHTRGSDQKFKQSYDLLLPNIKSRFCCFDYMKTLLDIVLILCMKDQITVISFPDVVEWSYKLYSMENHDIHNPCLEKYLYFIIFHFPTEERKAYTTQNAFELKRSIDQWKSDYVKKYSKNCRRAAAYRKETTLFFLGNGEPLHDLVYYELLDDIMEPHSRAQKWFLPEVGQVLRLMSGTLLEGGHTIKYYFDTTDGNRQHLLIPTSIPVHQRHWWQKKIYFFLGFSYAGPKAYGIRSEKSKEPMRPKVPLGKKQVWKRNYSPQKINHENSLAELEDQESKLIQKIKERKGKNDKHLQTDLASIRMKIRGQFLGE